MLVESFCRSERRVAYLACRASVCFARLFNACMGSVGESCRAERSGVPERDGRSGVGRSTTDFCKALGPGLAALLRKSDVDVWALGSGFVAFEGGCADRERGGGCGERERERNGGWGELERCGGLLLSGSKPTMSVEAVCCCGDFRGIFKGAGGNTEPSLICLSSSLGLSSDSFLLMLFFLGLGGGTSLLSARGMMSVWPLGSYVLASNRSPGEGGQAVGVLSPSQLLSLVGESELKRLYGGGMAGIGFSCTWRDGNRGAGFFDLFIIDLPASAGGASSFAGRGPKYDSCVS